MDPLYEDTLPREKETLQGAREYTTFWIWLTPDMLDDPRRTESTPDLCVEVTVVTGSLSDMNVALVDYPERAARRCGFYWPGGKINEGDVFNVGFSLEGYDGEEGFCGSDDDEYPDPGLFLLVMPQLHAKTEAAVLDVRLGFADVAP
jgi:hypothetical protein